MKKVIISCGGTGGHFYPGLSKARDIQSEGGEALLLLSGVHAAKQAETARSFGVPAVELPYMPHPGRNPVKALKTLRGIILGYLQSRREIRKFSPDEIWGMGSFAQLPVLLAHGKVPVYLHDGNALIGKANRFFSFMAERVETAFPPLNAEKCKAPVVCTGMPLRPELRRHANISRGDAFDGLNREFGTTLTPDKKTILIVGGSQGAATLNANIPEALKRVGNPQFQVLHLAGPTKIGEVKKAYEGAAFPVLALPSSEKMELFYGAADLIFARSGGSTVAELILFDKQSVLVPYPYAVDDHQTGNAMYMASLGKAVVVKNSDLTPEKVLQLLAEKEI